MVAAGKMEGEGEKEVFVNEEEQTMRVEEVIERHVGSLGISQIVQVVLVSLAWMFDSQNTLITIFTDAQPSEWRCKAEAGACGDGGGFGVCGLPPGTWEWVGGHGSTIVAEWGLICHRKFLAAIPASLFFLGSLLGSGVFGWLADSYLGRKKAVAISCILTSATAFLTSLSPNLSIYSLLRFANGFARSGIGICCLVLSTEVVGRKWRGQVSQYGFFFFTTGFLSLPLIAYPFRTSWRTLYRILSLLPLFYSLLLPLVSESPRWLLLKGRASEAVDVLNKFATLNGRKLPQNLKLADPVDAAGDFGEEAIKKKKTLWATGWAARRMVMVMLAGFGVGFVYYGVQLNVENLSFNLYMTVAINAVMEIPAVFIGSVLLGFTKRRLLFCGSIYIAGVACIACVFFSRSGRRWGGESSSRRNWPQLSIEAIGFMAASTAFDVLYIYSVELFPTSVRSFAVSMLRQALMLGASMAPVLVAVGRFSPAWSFLMFGLLSLASGLLGISLPETLNAPLYDTVEQQEKEESLINPPPTPPHHDLGISLPETLNAPLYDTVEQQEKEESLINPPPTPPHHDSGLQLNHLVN